MAKSITADDLLPLIACLTVHERFRLLRLVTATPNADAPSAAYLAMPPAHDEFSTDEGPLAWDAEGWENVA